MSAIEELDRTVLLCRDYVTETATGEQIVFGLRSTRILCISDIRNLSSHSGQTALVTLVCLLTRMGMQVSIDIPEVPMLGLQPPLKGRLLRSALIGANGTLISAAAVYGEPCSEPDLTFVLGDTDIGNRYAWRLSGDEWHGEVSLQAGTRSSRWTASWPVGSMVSAALAAAEAFKFTILRLPFRDPADRVFFSPSFSCGWSFGPLAVPTGPLDLGEVDVISAGAICQAALYALVRLPGVSMRGRVLDDDVTSRPNLNRNMLSRVGDVGLKKVLVITRECGSRFQLEPIAERFGGRVNNLKLAPRIIIGVDDIPSRWAVQRVTPGWLGVSGTSHFSISSSAHAPGEPCCGCLHPVDEETGANPIPTISFVSFWAGLALTVRLTAEALRTPFQRNRQHLWLTPLRMDGEHAAIWSPVAISHDCPVRCVPSRSLPPKEVHRVPARTPSEADGRAGGGI